MKEGQARLPTEPAIASQDSECCLSALHLDHGMKRRV